MATVAVIVSALYATSTFSFNIPRERASQSTSTTLIFEEAYEQEVQGKE
ncbi:hypothetical protein COLO4_37387 [Corchorus olitorius]|uniref:Uncharacterized protein n=1 Tax=Corchorus olitorius TaxID=93759 RepID=A0A1R3G251_9ROSI|nr:hypothetical protein COLO4_37387 [Corchorus olitorius]